MFRAHGIITVLNTPFNTVNEIDEAALRKNVQCALKAGVSGFLVPAMAAEVYKLSLRERVKMLRMVMEETEGTVPVFAGAGSTDPRECGEILRQYKNENCKHVLLQLPCNDVNIFKENVARLCAEGPETIMLQDWDQNGYGLPDELIVELFETIPNFRCLKVETVPAGIKYSRIMDLTGGRLHLSGGWAVMQMIEGLERGIHAFMPTGMHAIYVSIYKAYQSGDRERAKQIFRQLLPVLAFSNQHLDISIHFFKRLLFRQGIYNTANVREPILPFDAIHEKTADELIERIIHIEKELGINS